MLSWVLALERNVDCWEHNWGAAEVLGSLGCRSLCKGSAGCTVAVLSQLNWDRLFKKACCPLKSKHCVAWTKLAAVSWGGDDVALRPPSCIKPEEDCSCLISSEGFPRLIVAFSFVLSVLKCSARVLVSLLHPWPLC